MAAHGKILQLRTLLAERFVQPPVSPRSQLRTHVPLLDAATDGGLNKGSITEIISAQASAGSALLVHALLQLAQRECFFLALIDGCDSFDVQSAESNALAHLLWVRCENTRDAIKAADILLRDGNFPLVILDLILNPPDELRRVPATSWYRLQRLVESAPTALLVMSRHNMVASARTKILLENRWSLPDLTRDDATSQLQLRVRRSPTVAIAAS